RAAVTSAPAENAEQFGCGAGVSGGLFRVFSGPGPPPFWPAAVGAERMVPRPSGRRPQEDTWARPDVSAAAVRRRPPTTASAPTLEPRFLRFHEAPAPIIGRGLLVAGSALGVADLDLTDLH